jgi:hypothetical protein
MLIQRGIISDDLSKNLKHNTMTLQERLISEAREKFIREYCVNRGGIRWIRSIFYDEQDKIEKVLAAIEEATKVAIEQTIKEVLELAPGFQSTITHEVTYDVGVMEYMARIESITDTQHALRGIMKL